MTKSLNLTFWTNILSPHQAAYIRELAKVHNVTVVADEGLSAEREALGWCTPDCGQARVVIAPDRAFIREIVRPSADTVHLLSGYRGCKLSAAVLGHVEPGTRVGIIAECCDWRGTAGALRKVRCLWDVLRNRSRVDFALVMGSLGERWWRECGLPSDRVFPFGYVCETPAAPPAETCGGRQAFRLMYLGMFAERKGLDVLLRALALCKQHSWEAELIGSGPREAKAREMAARLGIAGRIRFLSPQRHMEAMRMLAQTDLLILPSRYDGWGAVVNEALMRGVPVICTTSCGASDLIRQPWLGSVVAAESVEGLRQALTEWITRGSRTAALSERIQKWSRCIEGDSMASYFLSVLDHIYHGGPRPVVPWRMGAHDELNAETP